jgi:predicted lipoprotein with Yx(FWY)xxD motif
MKRALLTASLASLVISGIGASEAMAAKKGVTLKVTRSDDYGKVLMTKGGLALYLFTKDGKGPSECYGDCATAWPPLLTKGKPRAGTGAIARKLGTTKRSDGTRQVTYGGHPVYFYVHDRPGLILCQDVFEFGGTWLLVNSAGKAVR